MSTIPYETWGSEGIVCRVLFLVVVRESLFQKCSTTEDQNYEEEEKSNTS